MLSGWFDLSDTSKVSKSGGRVDIGECRVSKRKLKKRG